VKLFVFIIVAFVVSLEKNISVSTLICAVHIYTHGHQNVLFYWSNKINEN